MAVHPLPEIALQEEVQLMEKAQQGDSLAFGSLVEPWRKPLFGYIYRMVCCGRTLKICCRTCCCASWKVSERIAAKRGSKAGSSASRHMFAWTICVRRSAGAWKRN